MLINGLNCEIDGRHRDGRGSRWRPNRNGR
jgi:hypothetical protein